MDTFMITHPMVIKSHELLDHFMKFHAGWIADYSSQESEPRARSKAEFCIGRLLHIICRWLDYHPFAFETDPTLIRKMKVRSFRSFLLPCYKILLIVGFHEFNEGS